MFDLTTQNEAVRRHVDQHHDDLFFLKSDDFATEHEYRIVTDLASVDMTGATEGIRPLDFNIDQDGYAFVGYGEALVAVVVGLEFPPWQLAGARDVCNEAGRPLRRMHWERGRPMLLSGS